MTSLDDVSARTDWAGINALSSRSAGYAVARKCLEVQAEAEAVDPSLRSATATTLAADAWSWYTGAVGEIEVGHLLSALGPEWFIRHAVPIGAGTKDVDHLVIGPAGVFAINTKNHAGASVWVGDYAMKINGKTTFYVNRAQGDGVDVSRRLASKVGFPVAVTSVVAILNQRTLRDDRAPENRSVRVIDAHGLVAWLVAQPHLLQASTLQLIELAAEEPETWHVDPHAADTLRVMSRFERLAAEVGTPPVPASEHQREQSSRSLQVATTRTNRETPTSRAGRQTASSRSRGTSRGLGRQPASVTDLVKLWFATTIIIVALFMLRGYADQPCTSAIGCVGPSIYMAVRPLLILGGVVIILVGFIGTIVIGLRLARR
jgi:Nuclease-related domain